MLAALIFTALTVARVDAIPARADACSAGLAKIERQITHLKSDPLEGPTAAQTVRTQLHRQPTPAAVKSAERKAKETFQTTLARAREANSRDDAAACAGALNRAKELYGIQ